MDKVNLEYLKDAYDELKKVFALKDKNRLDFLLHFYSEHRAKYDKSMNAKRWLKFLKKKYEQRMDELSLMDYNFKDLKDCDIFEISSNIVAIKPKDGSNMLEESFLFFHRDALGTWAWCQNADIIDHENPDLIDEDELYMYKKAA